MGCIPLGIEVPVAERPQVEELLRSHYYGFCKKVLWPVLHSSVNM